MTMPGTVSSTSPVRIIGRASSCLKVMAPWLAAAAMPTRFSAGFSTSAMLRKVDVPVTTTSAVSDSSRVESTVAVCPGASVIVRRCTVKLINRKLSCAGPAGTASNRYAPPASVVDVSVVAPDTRSIVTPGSAAPV